jgi:PAS domain-containing protein
VCNVHCAADILLRPTPEAAADVLFRRLREDRPDGTRVPFEPYPTPIFDSDGDLTGAVNMLIDITDRKRAEQAKQHLAAIVEFSDDAIVSINLHGIIQSWNAAAERIYGYTAREAIGKSVDS